MSVYDLDLEKVEPLSAEHHVLLGYKNFAGPVRSRFLVELRDNKRIMGVKCPVCNQVYVPAKPNCVKCLSKMDEWVEVSHKGTLITYTVIDFGDSVFGREPPFAYGMIRLDGADTSIVHFVGGGDLEDICIGMRLKAVFHDKRSGSILDISHFEPFSANEGN